MKATDLIKIIKKHTGPIELPVLTNEDVIHVIIQKQDLIRTLENRGGTSPWYVVRTDMEEVGDKMVNLMRLDVVN